MEFHMRTNITGSDIESNKQSHPREKVILLLEFQYFSNPKVASQGVMLVLL